MTETWETMTENRGRRIVAGKARRSGVSLGVTAHRRHRSRPIALEAVLGEWASIVRRLSRRSF